MRNKTITEQTFEQRTQAKRVAEASVAAQDALVHSAELDFNEFTELRAPVAGRIGDRRVSLGNLVTGGTGGNTTLLATIVSIDPIRFEFTFDEAAFLRYERLAKDGKDPVSRGGSAPVKIKLIDEQDFAHEGRMDFIDNVIDRATGTIRGRAQFANPDGLFTPGMFGNIQVPASEPYEALLVPDVAIGSEQARKYVLVVDAENVARVRNTSRSATCLARCAWSRTGSRPDDKVVVNGIARVRPGQKVTPQQEGAPPSNPAKPQANAG